MNQQCPRQRGLSLTEMLVVLTILGLLFTLAVPQLNAMAQRQRLHGTGETLRNDLHLARMHALGTGRSVQVTFEGTDQGSCYIVYQGEANACQCSDAGAAQCRAEATLINHLWLPAERGIRLAANVRHLIIDGRRGTVTPTATVRLAGSHGNQMAHVVAITGRVRTCGDAGYASPACPS